MAKQKMKTKSAATKRFRKTGTGKVRRNHGYTNHMFLAKSPKQKRKLRKATLMHKSDVKRIKSLIG
ncbi:LSU ribosomal protein L35P [Seinonella peptonophila]|uniref:Large ribosomal subunit protein bL35 n=1 Tax=Seinonella peptonophila TaxID=112248 RepID=A0A1M4U7X9_9BACL|nr:50S ribosomal protein L35 [Seinonella peptonophila]SHE52882.1 LSU ribosomal protein L35P [Seinonella peptonophila]